jgi:hypothetical protein
MLRRDAHLSADPLGDRIDQNLGVRIEPFFLRIDRSETDCLQPGNPFRGRDGVLCRISRGLTIRLSTSSPRLSRTQRHAFSVASGPRLISQMMPRAQAAVSVRLLQRKTGPSG